MVDILVLFITVMDDYMVINLVVVHMTSILLKSRSPEIAKTRAESNLVAEGRMENMWRCGFKCGVYTW